MINSFSAVEWIASNFAHVHLDAKTQSAVVNFSLIWNVFEGQFCDNSVSVSKLDLIAGEVTSEPFPEQILKQIFRFYKDRYVENESVNWRFDSLNFRGNDRKEVVAAIILSPDDDITQDAILALLIIVYRIRNNLFHGLKAFDMLHDQAQNLITASCFLSLVMESLKVRRNINH